MNELFLAGGGEMGERIRVFDWASTPLGPVESWPLALKTCVRIVLTSRQPMFVWWGRELIHLYNDAYKAIVGGKHPAALGQSAKDVWREIWDQVGPRASSAIDRNEGTYDEALLLIMERNGYPEETYYTFSYSPVPVDDGTVHGIICANSDDTQRIIGARQVAVIRDVAAQASLGRSVDEVRNLSMKALEGSPRDVPFAVLYVLDEEKKAATRVGTAVIEAGHAAAPDHVRLDDADAPWPFAEVLASENLAMVDELSRRFDELPTGKGWNVPPRRAVVLPVAGSSGGVRGFLVLALNPYRLFDDVYEGFARLVAGQFASNIATAMALEEEKTRAAKLAELDRAKTTFFSNVSHEFRTPLTLMLGPLEDALGGRDRTLHGENLETTYRNALRLLKLVNTLLEFSRAEAGRAQAHYEKTDLRELTTDLSSAFRSAVESAGLRFDVITGPIDGDVFVDRDMWEKIVLNLLSNAFKFTFEGGIRVTLSDTGPRVELAITDTGTGIAAKDLPHLFERFHRIQGARSRSHEGSGIGLALVHELVRLHGGTIAVESEYGKGTVVRVAVPKGSAHLPAERVDEAHSAEGNGRATRAFVEEAKRWNATPSALLRAASPQPSEPEPLSTKEPPTSHGETRRRILVADDNEDMREYVARLLRGRWTVETVGDGVAALEAARRAQPDLVIADVMMPGMDGFALLQQLRRDEATRTTPVIMLSARAGDEARAEGLEAGADDYLVKPFAARELFARVATHLQIASLRDAAEEERSKLHALLMQAPVAVALFVGPALSIDLANPRFEELVGRTELVGKPVREAFPEVADHPTTLALFDVYRTGETQRVTEMKVPLVRRGSLNDVFIDYVAQPTHGADGVTTGVMVVANDVTEKVDARRRIDTLRRTAEQASRAKDEFLSTLSHELRTPLNAIVGWSALLTSGAVPADQRERAFETIERNARIQARLVEDLLDLSRIEQGKLVLSVGPVEMVRVVEAAIDAVRPAADAKGVRLQPVLDSHATIVGDPDRLQQIVWNLLSNSIKFTPRGGRVQVQLRREQSYVEVTVADTGQGIDLDFLPLVFERFRQGDGSFTRRAGGLGLGLAIVRSLVELHGGTVVAESEGVGRGAAFTVRLPTAPLRADSVPAPAKETSDPSPPPRTFECPPILKDLRVLVVDDEHETRELLSYVLGQCETHVTTAGDTAFAMKLLQETHFDVLLSDVGMPNEDGYSFIQRVRAMSSDNRHIPAMALTAYARGEDRTRALKAGFNMHLSKPIEPSELLVFMAALVRDYQRHS